jgi:integrase
MLRKTKAMDLYKQGILLSIIMQLLGHERMITTSAFYAFATLDMMREAMNAATPAIREMSPVVLHDDELQLLYSLKWHQTFSRGMGGGPWIRRAEAATSA